jgi:hypothetical protein
MLEDSLTRMSYIIGKIGGVYHIALNSDYPLSGSNID